MIYIENISDSIKKCKEDSFTVLQFSKDGTISNKHFSGDAYNIWLGLKSESESLEEYADNLFT